MAHGDGSKSRASRRRPRRREIGQADGTTLVLSPDGSIDLVAADGSVEQTWRASDAAWPAVAFRFGVSVQDRTVAPHGPDTGSAKPGM